MALPLPTRRQLRLVQPLQGLLLQSTPILTMYLLKPLEQPLGILSQPLPRAGRGKEKHHPVLNNLVVPDERRQTYRVLLYITTVQLTTQSRTRPHQFPGETEAVQQLNPVTKQTTAEPALLRVGRSLARRGWV